MIFFWNLAQRWRIKFTKPEFLRHAANTTLSAGLVQSIGGKTKRTICGHFVQIPVQSGNYYPRHQALRNRTTGHRKVT